MTVATTDAFRNITVVQPTTPDPTITKVAAETVGDTLTITAGLGITITADPNSDSIVITNTGNGTGAYTEIADSNANLTFYPLFSRPFLPTDINELDTPPSYQLDAIYVDNTTTPMTYNPSTGTLTTLVFAGDLTGNVSGNVTGNVNGNLTGDVTGNVSGNAGTVTNGVYTNGSYSDPSWLTISATKVGLGNVTNESKATMFTDPTFTGTVSGVTATMVGLGNVTNESKATMFSSPTFTGTVSGITATMVGLGNVTNESKATMFSSPTFTGTVSGVTATMVGLSNVTNESKATMFTDPTFTGTVSGVTATMVGLGNVTNESKATMFTGPTFTNTTTMSKALVGASADFTRFPGALAAFSTTAVGIQQNESGNIGIIGETVATGATRNAGVYGVGYTSGSFSAQGVIGESHVSATGDTAPAVGVRGYSNDTHAGGTNVGLYGDAANSAIGNYSLYLNSGDIYLASAKTVYMNGNVAFSGAYTTTIPTLNLTNALGVSYGGTGTTTAPSIGAIVYGGNTASLAYLAGNITTSPRFVTSTGDGTNPAAPTLTSATGTGNVVLSTNPTITSPTSASATSSSDTDFTFDASTNEYFSYIQSTSGTARTINLTNLTSGRKVVMYLRNTNVATKVINIAASTTTTGLTAVNLSKGDAGGTSVTAVTLSATSGTASVTVFNAGGVIGGFIS